jgi:hypothetical protein
MKSILNIKNTAAAVILTLTLGLALPASASHRSHKTHTSYRTVSIVHNIGPLLDGHETHGGPKKDCPLFDGHETHGGPK